MHVQPISANISTDKPRNLPTRILKAVDNAIHLNGIPRSVRNTLAEICRYVPQDKPFATVFAHKNHIAKRVGASERTVYRHLAIIQENGLIDVLEQERKSRNGKFSVARIKLTQKAAEILGFIPLKNEVIHTSPSDKVTVGHTLTEPTNTNNQPTPGLVNGLPFDLSHLTSQGVSREGIFKLMGIATSHKHRLSDIITVLGNKIKDMRGKGLFGYLAKLAKGITDYAHQARVIREGEKQQMIENERKCKEHPIRQMLKTKTFVNAKKTAIFMVDQYAKFVQIISIKGNGTEPLNDPISWQYRINKGELITATAALETLALQNIDAIKERYRQQLPQQRFELFHGRKMTMSDIEQNTGIKQKKNFFITPEKSKSERVIDASIINLPKGRVSNMEAIFALLKNSKIEIKQQNVSANVC